MYEDITKNKIKTGFIVCIFIILITLIVYYICYQLELGVFSIVIALIISIITAWSSYYYSDKIVLKLNGAREATTEENRKLVDILDGLMISSGLEYRPKLYIMESDQPNAFATGRNPKHSVICVTTGLLNMMNYYELEGVVAHELSHIKNYDILLSTVVSVMVGFIVMLADWMTRTAFYSGRRKSSDSNGASGITLLLGLLGLIFGPIFAQLMQLALSRRREYLADATSVQFTRNPDGLISALQKLDSDTTEFDRANNTTAHMFIVNPFKADANEEKKVRTNLLSTHPPIPARIEALRKLK